MPREGILLVGFGSAHPQSIKAYKALQEAAQARFAPMPVRMAYTSELIRARRPDAKSDSVEKALARMRFEHFSHVYIQTLQLIPGFEYQEVAEEASRASAPGFSISLGLPLLTESPAVSLKKIATTLSSLLPFSSPQSAVLCIAHGSAHPAENAYHTLAAHIHQTHPHIFITGMKSPREPLYTSLAPYPHICLAPLFAVLGKHALEDMAGDKPASWLSTLTAHNFLCTTFLHGLAEFPAFVDIWLDRMGEFVGGDNPPQTPLLP